MSHHVYRGEHRFVDFIDTQIRHTLSILLGECVPRLVWVPSCIPIIGLHASILDCSNIVLVGSKQLLYLFGCIAFVVNVTWTDPVIHFGCIEPCSLIVRIKFERCWRTWISFWSKIFPQLLDFKSHLLIFLLKNLKFVVSLSEFPQPRVFFLQVIQLVSHIFLVAFPS